nr:retrotransposon protein, putative, Ty1-copia subclass [Tanacetum cinerariifolium]
MKDNKVWALVELPPNGKTVGSKWLFKKKTDMDGVVNTYKACLMVKGYTQTPGIDYEETFSPFADVRAIRILIAIAAYYDYKIWKIDVKTAFLNGYLNEEVYMEQPEDVKSYLGRCFAMKDLGEAAYILGIKIYRDRSWHLISLCQSAYIEKILKRYYMKNSKRGTVGSIMYDVRCTRLDVANTKDIFLVYEGDLKRELGVSCYTDVGYLTDADDLKSQTGYVFVLNGGVVDWKSVKKSIFATSSAEAEYIVAFDASKEAVWVRK